MGYQDYVPGTPTSAHALSTEQVLSVFPNMVVPCKVPFTPVQMEVREASEERGKMTARVCMLGVDLQTYRVFALPDKFFP
jgi:anaphase-promoting complex subunit 4